jgi:hypothetical protein
MVISVLRKSLSPAFILPLLFNFRQAPIAMVMETPYLFCFALTDLRSLCTWNVDLAASLLVL